MWVMGCRVFRRPIRISLNVSMPKWRREPARKIWKDSRNA